MKLADLTTQPQKHPDTQDGMRELAVQQLHSIGGGRTHGATPALLTDPVPPPREQN